VRIGHPIHARLATARHGVNSITGFGVPNQSGNCGEAAKIAKKRSGVCQKNFDIPII
jgi:hypothetical protein